MVVDSNDINAHYWDRPNAINAAHVITIINSAIPAHRTTILLHT